MYYFFFSTKPNHLPALLYAGRLSYAAMKEIIDIFVNFKKKKRKKL